MHQLLFSQVQDEALERPCGWRWARVGEVCEFVKESRSAAEIWKLHSMGYVLREAIGKQELSREKKSEIPLEAQQNMLPTAGVRGRYRTAL